LLVISYRIKGGLALDTLRNLKGLKKKKKWNHH